MKDMYPTDNKPHDVSYEEWDLVLTHSVVHNGERHRLDEPLHVRSVNLFGEGINLTYVVESMLDKMKYETLKRLENFVKKGEKS